MLDIIMGTLAACLILGVLMIWYHDEGDNND